MTHSNLYYIADEDFDLFVAASSPQEATNLWRQYFDLEEDTKPENIGIINMPTNPGAIPWDEVWL